MLMDKLTEKVMLRKRLRTILQQISSEEIQAQSATIAQKIFQTVWWHEADILLAFCSMAQEVETDTIITTALQETKIVGVPRVVGQELVFHRIQSLEQS